MTPGPQGLFIDIETSYLITADYGIHKRGYSLSYENVLQDWFMICASWQWVGGKRIYSTSLLDDEKRFKKDHTDDYVVVKALYDAVKQADFIVGHNAQAFDWKKFFERVVYHRLPPLPEPKFVDTLKESKRIGFTSRKLDSLSKRLGLRRKESHQSDMWIRCLHGEPAAIKEAVKYNRGDIPPLEDLYFTLRPYMKNHPNWNLWRGDGVLCCPHCGGTEMKKDGYQYTNVTKKQRYECLAADCGKWFSDSKALKRAFIR